MRRRGLLALLALALVEFAETPVGWAAAQTGSDGTRTARAAPFSSRRAATDDIPVGLRAPLQAISSRLPLVAPKDWKITVDDPQERRQRLVWLAQEFAAPSFKRADRVDEALLQSQGPAGLLHVGLIVVDFANCKNLRDARKRIDKTGRSNLLLPVLTLFGVRAQGHTLTFVLSETPLRREIDSLLKNLDEVLGKEVQCAD